MEEPACSGLTLCAFLPALWLLDAELSNSKLAPSLFFPVWSPQYWHLSLFLAPALRSGALVVFGWDAGNLGSLGSGPGNTSAFSCPGFGCILHRAARDPQRFPRQTFLVE